MGTFLSMTSIVGKTKNEVANSLNNYAKTVGGGLEKENLSISFIISTGDTTIQEGDMICIEYQSFSF